MKNKDRRHQEIVGIRQFFQDQWVHLLTLMSRLSSSKSDEHPVSADMLESVVTSTNARVRLVGDYKSRLRKSVRSLLDYVNLLVMVIPEPIDAGPDHYGSSEYLSAFFVSREHIVETFGRSEPLREFFKDPENMHAEEAYAILLMSRQNKTVLGSQYSGGILLNEVIQQSITFNQHSVQSSARSENELRQLLKQFMFDQFIAHAKRHMAFLNIEQKQQDGDDSLKNPENYLRELCNILQQPHLHFGLTLSEHHVDKMGVVKNKDNTSRLNQLNLREFNYGDMGKQIVVLIKYPRNQMPQPKTALSEAKNILGTLG